MVSAIILAAGSSQRFGKNKIQALLAGIPVIIHTLQAFQKNKNIHEIILVTSKEEEKNIKSLCVSFSKISSVVIGGKTRAESSYIGVQQSVGDICLVHNAANPLVTQQEISHIIPAIQKYNAAFVARKVSATLKQCKNDLIQKTIDRSNIVEAETPQGFKKDLFLKAVQSDVSSYKNCTDEMQILEAIGVYGKYIEAAPGNKKITIKEDLSRAEVFLKPSIKIGFGHDSHAFQNTKNTETSFITLGGVKIPHTKTIKAASDGDVLIHSLCNAIGTAIGEGSLSLYADDICKKGETDSLKYLDHIHKKMKAVFYNIGNISISIEGKEPKLEKHIPQIKEHIATFLHISSLQIGIACTTGEGLTSFGKGEGLQCFCSVQLVRSF